MSQQERQNFNWRPNDYSSQTRLRYDLEASHWITSIKSATTKTTVSLTEFLGVLGLVISLVLNIILVILLTIVQFFKWVNRLINPVKPLTFEEEYSHLIGEYEEELTDDEIDALIKENKRKGFIKMQDL